MNTDHDTRPMINFNQEEMQKALEKAVYARLRQFGKSFWIVTFSPWIHPYNEVRNCFCLMLDGCVQYKFQVMMYKGKGKYFFRFRVAKIQSPFSFDLQVKLNQRLSYQQLLDRIANAKVR
jgi:hypothetical protein